MCGEFDRRLNRLCGDFDFATRPFGPVEEFRPLSRAPKLLKSPPLTTSAIALGREFFLPASVFRFGTTGPPALLGKYPENWYADSGLLLILMPLVLGPNEMGRDAASDRLLCWVLFDKCAR